jgi:hypothetical protein
VCGDCRLHDIQIKHRPLNFAAQIACHEETDIFNIDVPDQPKPGYGQLWAKGKLGIIHGFL